jgi:mRNA interferase MazF
MKQGEIWKVNLDPVVGAEIKPDTVNGLTKDSAIDCFQIRSVSVDRLTEYVGNVDENVLSNVQDAVGIVVGLN